MEYLQQRLAREGLRVRRRGSSRRRQRHRPPDHASSAPTPGPAATPSASNAFTTKDESIAKEPAPEVSPLQGLSAMPPVVDSFAAGASSPPPPAPPQLTKSVKPGRSDPSVPTGWGLSLWELGGAAGAATTAPTAQEDSESKTEQESLGQTLWGMLSTYLPQQCVTPPVTGMCPAPQTTYVMRASSPMLMARQSTPIIPAQNTPPGVTPVFTCQPWQSTTVVSAPLQGSIQHQQQPVQRQHSPMLASRASVFNPTRQSQHSLPRQPQLRQSLPKQQPTTWQMSRQSVSQHPLLATTPPSMPPAMVAQVSTGTGCSLMATSPGVHVPMPAQVSSGAGGSFTFLPPEARPLVQPPSSASPNITAMQASGMRSPPPIPGRLSSTRPMPLPGTRSPPMGTKSPRLGGSQNRPTAAAVLSNPAAASVSPPQSPLLPQRQVMSKVHSHEHLLQGARSPEGSVLQGARSPGLSVNVSVLPRKGSSVTASEQLQGAQSPPASVTVCARTVRPQGCSQDVLAMGARSPRSSVTVIHLRSAGPSIITRAA